MDDTKKGYTHSTELKKPVLLIRAYNLFGIISIAYFKVEINDFAKAYCFSHCIAGNIVEEIILTDIQSKAKAVITDEAAVRRKFLEKNAKFTQEKIKAAQVELKHKSKRLAELDGLIESVYEDKVKGKMPEDICIKLMNRYTDEQKTLTEEIQTLKESLAESNQANADVDEFIRKIKRYINPTELTREMCMELIDRIIVGAALKNKNELRDIQIVYKVDIDTTV